MNKDKYTLIIVRDGKKTVEEFDAIIGLKILNNQVTLHILDSPQISESFWRGFPDMLNRSIEKGLNARKDALEKKQ